MYALFKLGTPIMFGANPIPETEVFPANITPLSNSSENGNLSSFVKGNNNATSGHIITQLSMTSSSIQSINVSYHLSEDLNSINLENISNNISSNSHLKPDEVTKTAPTDFVCGFYNPEFIIYSSLCSFFIPCVFMVFLYSRIFWVSDRH